MELRPQSKWLARQIARDKGITEQEAEDGLLELIARGHLRVLPGIGPGGLDAFEPVFKGGRLMAKRRKEPSHIEELRRLKAIWRDQVMGDIKLRGNKHKRRCWYAGYVGYWLADAFTMDATANHFREHRKVIVFVGQERLSKLVGCHATDVPRAIEALKESGHLRLATKQVFEHGKGRPPNEYVIMFWRDGKRESSKSVVKSGQFDGKNQSSIIGTSH